MTLIFLTERVTIRKNGDRLLENIKNKINLKVPAKASVWYVVSSVIARGIGALSTPIFTRLLTPEEYGLYPLYSTWLGVAGVVLTLELTGGVVYRGLQKYENNKSEFISSAFGLFLSIFISFCALYFAFNGTINSITGLSTFITSLMMLEIFANTSIAFYTARSRFEYRYKSVAALNLISALGIPFISILFILLTELKSEARILGSCIALSLVGVFALYKTVKDSRVLFNKDIWAFLLKFNLPLLPHYIATSLIIRVGEITIGKSFGTEALGKYSVAMSLGMALTVVTGGVMSALSPWLLRKIRAKEGERVRDLLLLLTKGLCLLCLVLLAAAPEALVILAPPAFRSALPAVYPLALSVIPIFLSNALTSAQMYFDRSAITALPSIATAAVSIALSLILLPRIDYRFVSVFVLISYALLTLLSGMVYKRLSGERPLHVKETLTAFTLTLGYAALLFLFRDVLLSRIILALPLLPSLFVLGRQALGKIKE